jgi:hypothetical protein
MRSCSSGVHKARLAPFLRWPDARSMQFRDKWSCSTCFDVPRRSRGSATLQRHFPPPPPSEKDIYRQQHSGQRQQPGSQICAVARHCVPALKDLVFFGIQPAMGNLNEFPQGLPVCAGIQKFFRITAGVTQRCRGTVRCAHGDQADTLFWQWQSRDVASWPYLGR